MPLKVFYSYAHEDNKLRDLLEKHLNLLKRQDLIETWHDRNIDAGKEWAREIDANLNTADIILLLISPDFVYSDYCYSKEMTRALQRHENGTARVIPIILRPGDYKGAPFSKLYALPTGALPVTDRKWHSRDEAFLNIAQGMRLIVNDLLKEQYKYNGDIYFYRQDYYKAIEAYDRAINLDPANSRFYIDKGQCLNKIASDTFSEPKEAYLSALANFDIAISIDPTIAEAYTGKGKALFELYPLHWGAHIKTDKSIILATYNQSIDLDPQNEDAYIGKADTFRYFGDYDNALATYEEAIKIMSYIDKMVYNHKADTLYELERYKEALNVYERIIYEFPDDSYAYGGKGNVLYKLNRDEEAMEAYDKATLLQYHNPFLLYVQKGKILHRLQKYQSALNAYDQALKLDENEDVYRSKVETLHSMANEASQKAEELAHPF